MRYEKARDEISKIAAERFRQAHGFRDLHGIEFGVAQNIFALIRSGNPARAFQIYQAEVSGGKRPTKVNYNIMLKSLGDVLGANEPIVRETLGLAGLTK